MKRSEGTRGQKEKKKSLKERERDGDRGKEKADVTGERKRGKKQHRE